MSIAVHSVYTSKACMLRRMKRARLPASKNYGTSVPVGAWWIRMAEGEVMRTIIARGMKPTHHTAGVVLALAAGEAEPWSHAKMWRCFSGKMTDDVVRAILVLCPHLPRPVYYPRDYAEAIAYEEERRRADARRKRASLEPQLLEVERREGVASIGPREVASDHVETETRRGARRGNRARGGAGDGDQRRNRGVATRRAQPRARRS